MLPVKRNSITFFIYTTISSPLLVCFFDTYICIIACTYMYNSIYLRTVKKHIWHSMYICSLYSIHYSIQIIHHTCIVCMYNYISINLRNCTNYRLYCCFLLQYSSPRIHRLGETKSVNKSSQFALSEKVGVHRQHLEETKLAAADSWFD